MSCNTYYDYWNYYSNSTCSSLYLNETAQWNLQIVNDASAFGDSKYALMLRNSGLSNLCLSYSYPYLRPCNSDSFDFLFGFKITDISQIENQLSSSLMSYSDTIIIQWIDYFNSSTNYTFVIYYFNSFREFQGYTCGSDRTNSPINFTVDSTNYSTKYISVNLTLNDLITCGCRKDEDSNYMYFYVKAAYYDPANNLVFSDYYRIIFLKIAGSDQALYVGYNSDWNDTQGDVIENNRGVTYINVSNSLSVNVSNLISKKYLDKNKTQNIHIGYGTKNRFNLTLVNNSIYFVNNNNSNSIVNVPASFSNGVANEMDISFDLSQLPSGYYTLRFYVYFQILTRLLAETTNTSTDPTQNFTSQYQSTISFYVGSQQEIQKKVIEEQEALANNSTEDHSYLFVIIGVVCGLLGLLIVVLSVYYLIRRIKKKKDIEHQPIGQDASPELVTKNRTIQV